MLKYLNFPLLSGSKLIENPDFSKYELWGLYFSAHWCPPCRGFTPYLAKFYNQIKNTQKKSFEIVFVSQDHDEVEFENYYKTMPWMSIPYKERHQIQFLGSLLRNAAVPTLYIFNNRGQLITGNGVRELGIYGVKSYEKWLEDDKQKNPIPQV